jgi:ElaB/YqjD/DUF883 family membrane-anchored ribosome-binding protein
MRRIQFDIRDQWRFTQGDRYERHAINVHANPWKAIGVVGLAGLIVGSLIARR